MFNMDNTTEKRQYQRKRYAEPVNLHFIRPEKDGGCLSADLSEGGVRLKVTDFIAPGTEVAVNIQLEDMRVVELIGKVAWAEKDRFNERYQIGVKFDYEDENLLPYRDQIQKFIGVN